MFRSETKIVTWYLFLAVIVETLFLSTSYANASMITTITVKEKDGVSTANYPLTFGLVFSEGTVTGSVYLNNYPTQTDVKTTYDDGSIRFAVISALVPVMANSDTVLNVNTTGTAASPTAMTKTEILATDIGATIDLTGLSGSGYSGDLQANLRTAITNESTLNYWIEGGICTEILVDQNLNNSLDATWEVRFYPGTSYIRISHVIENVDSEYRGNINYAVEIKQGDSSPASVYTKADFQHNINSRWRKVFWLGTAPSEVEIQYDIDYLISTKMIPNYDTSLTMDSATMTSKYSSWSASDHDIMDTGIVENYLPTTGGREDIGVFPTWTVRYLLSMDNRMREIMLNSADVTAGCPMHYREGRSGKTFTDHIVNIDDRPSVWTNESHYTSGVAADELNAPIGTITSDWTIDRAHQASFDYIPYLITGDYFYLQEMYFWAGYDLSASNYNSSYGRDYSAGLIRDEQRAEGWAFRNIVQAAVMATTGDIEKAYFNTKIANNITQWETDILRYPLRQWDLSTTSTTDGLTSDVKYGCSPWQNDYNTLVMAHVDDLGYDVRGIMDEFSKFTINRFYNSDFNKYNGTPYRFPVQLTDDTYVQTWAAAKLLFTAQPTSYTSIYDGSYHAVALGALSQLTSFPNGEIAYNLLKNELGIISDQTENPTWAFLPRGPKTPVNLRIE